MPIATNAEPLYDIEVIIFERSSQSAQEGWHTASQAPDLSLAVGTLEKDSNGSLPRARLLNTQHDPIAYTLKKHGATVHHHVRWRQAVKNRNTPQWLLVDNQRLRGLLQMSKGRYLHFNTDLYLEKSNIGRPYRIQLDRRMRSSETHYIDHPKVGVIVRAERYVAAIEPETEAEPIQAEPVEPPNKPNNGLPSAMPDPS